MPVCVDDFVSRELVTDIEEGVIVAALPSEAWSLKLGAKAEVKTRNPLV